METFAYTKLVLSYAGDSQSFAIDSCDSSRQETSCDLSTEPKTPHLMGHKEIRAHREETETRQRVQMKQSRNNRCDNYLGVFAVSTGLGRKPTFRPFLLAAYREAEEVPRGHGEAREASQV